jgi:hypothetical protein
MDEAAERTDIRRARAGSYADWAARPHAITLAFVVMLGIAVLVRLVLTRSFPAPWIMGDELHYSELARSFASDGVMRLREEPSTLRTLYPVLISPAWLANSVGTAYTLTKVINVLLMTSAAVPFFLWARRLVRPIFALAGTLLFLLLPAALYANLIMTESAFLPAFLLSVLLAALALEHPTPMRQVLAIVSIALPVAIRAQGVVLVPILLTALVLKVLLDARAQGRATFGSLLAGLRAYVVTLAVIGGAALAYIALKLVQGHGLSSGLSAYSGTAQAHYSLREVARWSVLHLAELVFAVGLIPASALIVIAGVAWAAPRATQPRERVFLALTVATTFWMVLLVAAFASHYSLRIEERNLFYVEPLLLLAFVLWLDKGLPRPPRLTAAAVVAPAALLLSLPFESLFNLSLLGDTPGLIPLMRVAAHLKEGVGGTRVLLALGVLAAGLFFVLVPRRWGVVLAPIGIALFLVFSSVTVLKAWTGQARATHASQGTNDLSWIDQTIGSDADAAFLFTPDLQGDPHPLLQSEFWNRSVRRVFLLDAADPNGYPAIPTTLSRAGRLTTAPATRQPKYIVTAPGVDVDGRLLARTPRLTLYQVSPPLRLADRSSGLSADGWTGADATYTRYHPGAKIVTVELSRPALPAPPGRVRIELVSSGSTLQHRAWIARSDSEKTFRFQAPAAPFSVRIQVAPTFSPAQFGLSDTRQLGVLAKIRALDAHFVAVPQ